MSRAPATISSAVLVVVVSTVLVVVVMVNVDHMTQMAVPVVLMVVAVRRVRVVVEVGDGGCDDGGGEQAVTVGVYCWSCHIVKTKILFVYGGAMHTSDTVGRVGSTPVGSGRPRSGQVGSGDIC